MSEYSFTIEQILSNPLTQSDYDEITSIYQEVTSYLYMSSASTYAHNKDVSRLNKLEAFIESANIETDEISNLINAYNSSQSYLTNIDSNAFLSHAESFFDTSYNNLSHNYTGTNSASILLSNLNNIKPDIIKSKELLSDLQSLITAEKKALELEASMVKSNKNIAETAKRTIYKRFERYHISY